MKTARPSWICRDFFIQFIMVEDYQENYITGWIKLYRSFIKWEWFEVPNMVTIFIYCLLKANHTDKSWRGIEIKKGSFVTSLDTIHKETKVSKQSVRTCLKKLQKSGEINTQTNTRNTVITICKYVTYQSFNEDSNTPTNKQLTNHQQTTNKQLTPTNNDNNYNNEKNDEEVADDVFLSVDILKQNYIENEKLCKAFISNPKNVIKSQQHLDKRLDEFVLNLKEVGRFTETFSEFSSYFRNWNKSVPLKTVDPLSQYKPQKLIS